VLGTICGFDHPEDLEAVPAAGVLLASGMWQGAGLHAVSLAELATPDPRPWRIWPPPKGAGPATAPEPAGEPGCTAPPRNDVFSAHGLGARLLADGTPRVAVVNHGGRESVELFDLAGRGREARLVWRGCVTLPPDLLGNDVALAPDGEIVVTNFVPRVSQPRLWFEIAAAALGFESGEVLAWHPQRGWRAIPGSRGAGPNGIVLSPDGATVYFAENGGDRIVRLPRAGGEPSWIDVGHNVDNLSWDGAKLLAVTHLGGPGAILEACLMDWAIVEADPATRSARRVFAHDGEVLCGATSALRLGDRIYVGSMNETRIGVLRAARAEP
jgi:hypothetical protein